MDKKILVKICYAAREISFGKYIGIARIKNIARSPSNRFPHSILPPCFQKYHDASQGLRVSHDPLSFLQNNRAFFKIFCYKCQIFPWPPQFPTCVGPHVQFHHFYTEYRFKKDFLGPFLSISRHTNKKSPPVTRDTLTLVFSRNLIGTLVLGHIGTLGQIFVKGIISCLLQLIKICDYEVWMMFVRYLYFLLPSFRR